MIVLVKNTCHPILCRILTRNLNVILQSMTPNKSLHWSLLAVSGRSLFQFTWRLTDRFWPKADVKANILDYGSKTDAITTQAMLGRQLATEGGPLEANLIEYYLRSHDLLIH